MIRATSGHARPARFLYPSPTGRCAMGIIALIGAIVVAVIVLRFAGIL